jgi:hypothetical protein
MTYWASLWYAGAVVLQLGYEGQTLNDCELLTRMMREDIEESYADPSKIEELSQSPFPTNQFTVSCETEVLPTAKAYAK